MQLTVLGIVGGLSVLLCGCLNPLSAGHADRYYAWGIEAEKSGDLQTAKKFYFRALRNAQAVYIGSSASSYIQNLLS